MTQRNDQKKATVQRILTAAQVLFMNHGYTAVTTRMIAEAADVRQPLLYHYFKTKEALYLAVVMAVSEDMASKIAHEQIDAQNFGKKVKRLGHLLTDDNMMNLQLVLHDVGNLSSKAQADVFQAWQVGLLSPLDRFFSTFDEQLAPTYRVREVTLYFLTVLAAYLQPTVGTSRGNTFQNQLSLDCALQMFCTGVLRPEANGEGHED